MSRPKKRTPHRAIRKAQALVHLTETVDLDVTNQGNAQTLGEVVDDMLADFARRGSLVDAVEFKIELEPHEMEDSVNLVREAMEEIQLDPANAEVIAQNLLDRIKS